MKSEWQDDGTREYSATVSAVVEEHPSMPLPWLWVVSSCDRRQVSGWDPSEQAAKISATRAAGPFVTAHRPEPAEPEHEA